MMIISVSMFMCIIIVIIIVIIIIIISSSSSSSGAQDCNDAVPCSPRPQPAGRSASGVREAARAGWGRLGFAWRQGFSFFHAFPKGSHTSPKRSHTFPKQSNTFPKISNTFLWRPHWNIADAMSSPDWFEVPVKQRPIQLDWWPSHAVRIHTLTNCASEVHAHSKLRISRWGSRVPKPWFILTSACPFESSKLPGSRPIFSRPAFQKLAVIIIIITTIISICLLCFVYSVYGARAQERPEGDPAGLPGLLPRPGGGALHEQAADHDEVGSDPSTRPSSQAGARPAGRPANFVK